MNTLPSKFPLKQLWYCIYKKSLFVGLFYLEEYGVDGNYTVQKVIQISAI